MPRMEAPPANAHMTDDDPYYFVLVGLMCVAILVGVAVAAAVTFGWIPRS